MILLHGTTRWRAEQIVRDGPRPDYGEPGGLGWDDGFCLYVETGPFLFGAIEDYAYGKAREFPNEGGPVILAVDIPDEIVHNAVNDWFPLSQGLVQFDLRNGLEELRSVWATLTKEIWEL